MEYEILTSLQSRLGEGPLYHAEENAVFWTDIDSGLLHRHSLADSLTETVHSGVPIGGFTIQEDGSLLLFRAGGAIHLLRDLELTVVLQGIEDERESRFNDVAAAPGGHVFCGTMPTPHRKGRLYRLDLEGILSIVLEGVGCSNGMGWSPDESTMYFTDTSESTIYAFDYDVRSGQMSNRRVLFDMESKGYPDGMTVDGEGNLWTGLWDGGCLLKISPEGALLERIPLPAKKITCPTFGGPDLEELYVTSAGGHLPEEGEGAGELMRLRPGVKGKPEYRSRIFVETIHANR
jgi:sugar lactone lactonase YvrE